MLGKHGPLDIPEVGSRRSNHPLLTGHDKSQDGIQYWKKAFFFKLTCSYSQVNICRKIMTVVEVFEQPVISNMCMLIVTLHFIGQTMV